VGVGALVGTSGDADTPGVLGENTGNGEGIRGTTRSARGGVVGVNNNPADDAGQAVDGESCGVFGESVKGEGVRGVSHSAFGGVVGVNDGAGIGVKAVSKDGPGLAAFSTGNDGVHGETNAESFVGGVTGVAVNANGVATGVLGRSSGSGPGVSGLAAQDSGVLGFHGDPRLNETTVGNDGAVAGVFGASDVGAGVVGYSRNTASFGVIAFGGLRASAINHPTAGEFNGKVQVNGDMSVTGDIFMQGADCAEHFDIAGSSTIEPGSVVVIDNCGGLRESHAAYDRKVAGVVSGAGQYRPGLVLDAQESSGNRLAVALMGKVFCKVDARCEAIAVGDLLTSSATPGHAMKAADPGRAFGAVIGKALAPLTSGKGLIPILVALQ